jgi:hypothetical protein
LVSNADSITTLESKKALVVQESLRKDVKYYQTNDAQQRMKRVREPFEYGTKLR